MANFWSRAKVIVWGKTPDDPREAKLLVKIDWFLLSSACLMYWVNYLDRLNISGAYVSGMQEDLNMHGNELNVINTCFTVGYTVFLIPHNLTLLKVRPKYWLTFCCFCWGLLTLGIYKVSDYRQICVIRFFQGAFESSTFTGIHLILSRWYKKEELALRTSLFVMSGQIGNIFSSTLQSAIYTNMDDYSGIAGWRWLFIIDFIITVFISIYLFIFFIDYPETCNSFFFTPEELKLAKDRLPEVPETAFDWSVIKRVVGRWHWWLFSFLWVLGGENESFATNSLFSLWLKSNDYTVQQRNQYPMGVYGVGAVANVVFAFYIDYTGARYQWKTGIFIAVTMLVASILLIAKPLTDSYVFVAHYLSGISYGGQTSFFSWASIVCARDLEERAVVLASMNMFSNAVNAWWSILFYSADTAPKFRKGCYAMLATSIASGFVCAGIRYLQKRDEQHMISDGSDHEAQSTDESLPPHKGDFVAVKTRETH